MTILHKLNARRFIDKIALQQNGLEGIMVEDVMASLISNWLKQISLDRWYFVKVSKEHEYNDMQPQDAIKATIKYVPVDEVEVIYANALKISEDDNVVPPIFSSETRNDILAELKLKAVELQYKDGIIYELQQMLNGMEISIDGLKSRFSSLLELLEQEGRAVDFDKHDKAHFVKR